jgi:hypothetical protein
MSPRWYRIVSETVAGAVLSAIAVPIFFAMCCALIDFSYHPAVLLVLSGMGIIVGGLVGFIRSLAKSAQPKRNDQNSSENPKAAQ